MFGIIISYSSVLSKTWVLVWLFWFGFDSVPISTVSTCAIGLFKK